MAGEQINFDMALIIDRFDKSIDETNKKLERLHDTFQENTKTSKTAWASFVGNLGASTFIGIAKSIGNMGLSAIEAAGDIEQMRLSFDTLTGSVDKSKKLMADLQKFGAETPFELKGLAEASKTLLAAKFNTEQVIPTLKQLGDIAAITGDDLGNLTVGFARMASSGRVSLEELDKFRNSGIFSALAEETGISVGKIRKSIESGAVTFNDFENAIKKMTSTGGSFADGMIKQSTSLNGLISTSKDSIAMLAAAMGEALLPVIKNVVISFISLTEKALGIINWIKEWSSVLTPLAIGLTATATAVGLWASRTAILTAATQAAAIAQGAFNVVMNANPIGIVITALGLLATGIMVVANNWDAVKSAFYTASIAILESIQPLEEGFRKVFGTILEIWGRTYGTLVQGAIDLGGKFASVFGVQLPASMVNFKDNILATAEAIKNGSGTIAGQIDSLIQKKAELDASRAGTPTAAPESNGAGAGLSAQEQAELDRLAALNAEKLAKEQEYQGQLALIKQESKAMELQLEAEAFNLDTETRHTRQQLALQAQQEYEQAKIQASYDAELQKAALLNTSQEQEKAKTAAFYKYNLESQKLQSKQTIDVKKLEAKQKHEIAEEEKRIQESLLQSTAGFFRAGAALSKENSKEAKAMAIIDATIQTYLAATKAFASVPYPANFAAAASAIAAGFVNVRNIASAGNFATGGEVGEFGGMGTRIGGYSPAGDQLMARVSSGETIFTKAQTDSVQAREEGFNSALVSEIRSLKAAMSSLKVVVVADDNEIARSVSRGVRNGVVIGETT